MPDKIVNHFVLADGSTAKYDAKSLSGFVDEVSFNLSQIEFERGGYDPAGQKTTTNTEPNSSRARTKRGIMMKANERLVNNSTGGFAVIYSDMNGQTFTDSGWLLTSGASFMAPYDGVARITVRRVDGATFDDAELETICEGIVGDVFSYTNLFNQYGRSIYEFLPSKLSLANTGYGTLDYNLFDAGGILNNGNFNIYAFFQVATASIIETDVDLNLVADDGYQFNVFYYDSTDALLSFSGWITSTVIRSGQRFKMTIRENPIDATKRFTGVEWLLVDHVKFKTVPMTLAESAIGGGFAYKANGLPLPVTKTAYNMELLNVTSTPVADVSGVSSYQGMTINNGVIFQLFSDNKIELINYATGAHIALLDITSDHGDTIDFSNEYYDVSDEFPLAYITADTTPAKVYVNRITRTGTELVKTYTFPADKTGYYAGHCLDPVNKILYQVGYTDNNYYQDPNGTNYLIVSVWDLKNVTDNGNNVYTPAFVRSFKLPFYTTLQGQAFFNGLIFIVSSHWNNPNTKIIVIDPASESICTIMDEFNTIIKTEETEGLAFVENGDKYDIVLKPNEPRYFKVTF